MTTRGLKEQEFIQIADLIIEALSNSKNEHLLNILKDKSLSITKSFPIYKN